MMNYTTLKELLPPNGHVYITGHVHPDGDCVGATLGLYNILKEDGITATVLLEEQPKTYEYMAGFDKILTLDLYNQKKEGILSKPAGLIVMDSGDLSRIEPFKELFDHASLTINIDHHHSNTHFGMHNYVDAYASSTCEMVGLMIESYKEQPLRPLTQDVATCLYTGIIYDTGVFKHSNTRKETHLVASSLVDTGIDFTDLVNRLYFTRTRKSIKATELAYRNMSIVSEFPIITTYLSYEECQEYGLSKSDTEAVVNLILEVDEVSISLFLLEMEPGVFKGSLRSQIDVDVCSVAMLHGGGGHKKAAGFTIEGQLEDITEIIVKEICQAYERDYKRI